MPKPAMISIIDDDASVRAAVENLLSSLGYRVSTFGSAEAFLQSDRQNDAECVIADVNMPVRNGVELLVRLRERGNNVPFIFITGFPDEAAARKAMSAGAACILTKPFEKDNLIQEIESALRGWRAGARG